MDSIPLSLVRGITLAYLLVALGLTIRDRRAGRRDLRRRLKALVGADEPAPDVIKDRRLSALPWLKAVLLGRRRLDGLARLHARAGVRTPLSVFLLLSALLALAAWLAASPRLGPAAGAVAILAAALPCLWLRRAARRRLERFERQLPDALDLLARCLKAGHTLLGGVRAAAEEMDEPLGGEFRAVVAEVNYGKSVREALFHLSARIDSPDLRFLIVAANIQGESGGNLGEVLVKLADLIRSRFAFRRKVRVLTAQGRCSARILTALPFALLLGFHWLNPESARILLHDPTGRLLGLVTAGLMGVGIVVIRRMVALKA